MEHQLKFHLSLNVSNIEKTIGFYQKLFAVEPAKVKPDYAKFELDNPGLVISFISSGGKVSKDFGHLGFRVSNAEELSRRKAELNDLLKITLEETHTACCYARQDKFWVQDPDGYEWEVYHLVEDVEENDPKHSAVACC